jgi:integrase
MTAAKRKIALKVDLTDRFIKALPKNLPTPPTLRKRVMVWDAATAHLAVRVTHKGHRTFVVVKRRPGDRNPVTHVIGAYPSTSLADARKKVPGILTTLGEGQLPAEVEREKRREERRQRKETFGAAVEEFIASGELDGLRSGHETETVLRREFLGQVKREGEWVDDDERKGDRLWRDLPMATIDRKMVVERLDAIKRRKGRKGRDGKFAARHALAAARKFFNWCVDGERFGIETAPTANIRNKTIGFSKFGTELKRKRVLSDGELCDVWAAAEDLTARQREMVLVLHATTGATNNDADPSIAFDPVEPLVKLLALTGQRLSDIACARWPEIDADKAMLTVPPERYKTEVAHEVPLAPSAIEIIEALPRFGRGFVLTTTGGKRPVGGFSKMKRRLDKAIAERRKKAGAEPMRPWVFHDLRRTVRTRLISDLNVEAFIAERVIGHALPGLHGVYDQGSHRAQKREAMMRWQDALALIVGPRPTRSAKVFNITGGQRQ